VAGAAVAARSGGGYIISLLSASLRQACRVPLLVTQWGCVNSIILAGMGCWEHALDRRWTNDTPNVGLGVDACAYVDRPVRTAPVPLL